MIISRKKYNAMLDVMSKTSEDQQERKSFDGHIVGDEIVNDDGIQRVTKIDEYAGYECVRIMTKEAFIEAYNKFIVNDEEEDSE